MPRKGFVYKKSMRKLSNPIPVRFYVDTVEQLDACSKRNGIPRNELIRMALERFLAKIAEDGEIEHVTKIMGGSEDHAVAIGGVTNAAKKNKTKG